MTFWTTPTRTGGDETASVQAAIAAAGVGGVVVLDGEYAVSGRIAPLARQRILAANGGGFHFTGADGLDLAADGIVVEGLKIRGSPAFTGAAIRFGSTSCRVTDVLVTNILGGTGFRFDAGACFYNVLGNAKVTSAAVGLYIAGVANNNIVDNLDVYGTVDVGLLCDGAPSQFTLRNVVLEATTASTHLKVTNPGACLTFHDFRCEGNAQQFVSIVPDARVKFEGSFFAPGNFVNGSLISDLFGLGSGRLVNDIPDPLFVNDFSGAPEGWSATGSVTKCPPPIYGDGYALEVTGEMSFVLTGAALAAAKGKRIRVHGLTQSVQGKASIVAMQSGPAPTSQTTDNTGEWAVHSCELSVPASATAAKFVFRAEGLARLYSPVLQIESTFYRLSSYPSKEIPWFRNGLNIGSAGNRLRWEGGPPAGVAKRGDYVFHRLATAGVPWAWRCVGGSWVADRARGTFVMDPDGSTTVVKAECTPSSVVLLMPTNGAAGEMCGSALHPYVIPSSGSFTVNTGSGGSASGTETFAFLVLN